MGPELANIALVQTLDRALGYAIQHGEQYEKPEQTQGPWGSGSDITSQSQRYKVYELVHNLPSEVEDLPAEDLTIRVTDIHYNHSIGNANSRIESWMEDRWVELLLGQDLIIHARKILSGEKSRITPNGTEKTTKEATEWIILDQSQLFTDYMIKKIAELEELLQ